MSKLTNDESHKAKNRRWVTNELAMRPYKLGILDLNIFVWTLHVPEADTDTSQP